MRAVGIHKPIPAIEWRNIISGLYETHQHNYLVMCGVVRAGYIALQDWSKEDGRAEVCIALLPEFQNRGVGKTALQLLMQIAALPVSEGGAAVKHLVAQVVEDNIPSRKLFESSTFTLVATIPQYHKFANARVGRCIYTKRFG